MSTLNLALLCFVAPPLWAIFCAKLFARLDAKSAESSASASKIPPGDDPWVYHI